MATSRWPIHLPALLASTLLCGCMTVGPDFHAPQVPWLEGWSGGAWRTLAGRSAAPRDSRRPTSGGATSTTRCSTSWSPRRSASIPACAPPACASWRRARSSASPAARSTRSCSRSAPRPCAAGNRGSNGAGPHVLDGGPRHSTSAWELDFWGKFRRGIEAADAGYFASIAQYDDLQVLVAAQAASFYATIRTLELRLRIAHENAALQQRSLEITERLFRSGNESELDVQQARTHYLSTLATIPETRGQSAPDTERAVRPARPAARPAARDGERARADSRSAARGDRRPAGRAAAPPARRARGRDAAGRAVGADRGEQGRALSVDRARRLGRSVGDLLRLARRHARLGTRPGARLERLRPRPADEPGAGAGRALPAALRAVPGRRCCARPASSTMRRSASPRPARRSRSSREAVQAARRSLDIADDPVPRRPRRLPARARLAARALQPAGAPGRQRRAASRRT